MMTRDSYCIGAGVEITEITLPFTREEIEESCRPKPLSRPTRKAKINVSIDVGDVARLDEMSRDREYRTGWPCQATDIIRDAIKQYLRSQKIIGTPGGIS